MTVRRFAIAYLLAEAVGAATWWVMLLAWPVCRAEFRAADAPDTSLLAFAVPDGLLFIGTAMLAAHGLRRNRRWAWPWLCVHAGAAVYAALYCVTLTALTAGDAWLGAVLMAPPLVVPGWLAVRMRPGGAK